eukprot:6182604-Pleurochrysis_carterae.AAC.1
MAGRSFFLGSIHTRVYAFSFDFSPQTGQANVRAKPCSQPAAQMLSSTTMPFWSYTLRSSEAA